MNNSTDNGGALDPHRVAYLIAGFIRNSLTEEEHDQLDEWISADDRNMKLFEDLTDEANIEANLKYMDDLNAEKKYSGLVKRIDSVERKSSLKVWLTAAAVAFAVGLYIVFNNDSEKPSNTVVLNESKARLHPGGNFAKLTLSDGTIIDLSSQKKDFKTRDLGVEVHSDSIGSIAYSELRMPNSPERFNILSTPIGGQYMVKLPDNTLVWLNASSSLRYPIQFSGSERVVELDGEGYFEVSKDANHPFKVLLKDSASVSVLGTHFNVHSYQDEKIKEIALLEGKVKVNSTMGNETLEPGSKAVISKSSISKILNIDAEETIGWKNGYFVFQDADIETIMRAISRWYGAKVEYQAKSTQLFNASISRQESLEKLLHLIELSGYVHFKIKNETIYVLP